MAAAAAVVSNALILSGHFNSYDYDDVSLTTMIERISKQKEKKTNSNQKMLSFLESIKKIENLEYNQPHKRKSNSFNLMILLKELEHTYIQSQAWPNQF